MVIGIFLFYFILFLLVFSLPSLKNPKKTNDYWKLFIIPALLGLLMAFFSLIKVYFIYKILIFLFLLVTALLSYWQWGEQIRRWLNR